MGTKRNSEVRTSRSRPGADSNGGKNQKCNRAQQTKGLSRPGKAANSEHDVLYVLYGYRARGSHMYLV